MDYKENIFLKNVSTLFIGTVLSQVINVGGLLILSRLYQPEEFATLALFMAIGLIVFSFSTFQLDQAIVKTESLKERLGLMKLSFIAIFITSFIGSGGLLIWSNWNEELNKVFIFTLTIFFIFNGGNQVLIYLFNSEEKYKNIAIARILLAIINLCFAVFLFYWNAEIGLFIALTIANIFSLFSLLIFFGKRIKNVFKIKWKILIDVLKKNERFIKFSTPANFLDVLSYQIAIIFLSKYFSEEITGSFFMAMRIVLLPTALVGSAIGQVFYKEISDKFSQGNLQASDFWKIWKVLFLLGVVPYLLMIFFGAKLFGFVLGEEWVLSGEMAAILAITGLFIFVSSPTSSGFVVINQQKYNLLNSSIRVIYTVAFLIWSASKNDIFLFLWSYAIAELVMIILYNLVMMNLLKKAKVQL